MNSERPTNGIDDTHDETQLRALLEPFAPLLRAEAVWAEPPAGLETSIVEQIRAAPRLPGEARTDVARPDVSWLRRSWVAPALAAAAAAVAFLAGFVVADRNGDDGVAAVADVVLVGTELAPDAAATGDVVDRGAGYAIRLAMAGLPPAAEGEYYEGWLRADDGEMVSVGTFHMRNGDSPIVLWSGVKIAEYHTLLVTEEIERAGEEPSDRVVLEGEVARR